MDIKIIKETKAQCELEIKAILVMFEKQTGLVVSGLNIGRQFTEIGCTSNITIVMDVRLPD